MAVVLACGRTLMVTLIKEDGTGKTDANSYADYEECVAYHEARSKSVV